jgi:hypothetical protein
VSNRSAPPPGFACSRPEEEIPAAEVVEGTWQKDGLTDHLVLATAVRHIRSGALGHKTGCMRGILKTRRPVSGTGPRPVVSRFIMMPSLSEANIRVPRP